MDMGRPIRLRQDVEALAMPGGRMVGTPGHDRARHYLITRMSELELQPYRDNSFELPYRYGGQDFCNLIGEISGENRDLPPVLVGAHYDSVGPFACADDNAAAVAIVLELVRSLQTKTPTRSVLVAFFDAEEPPYFHTPGMGSTHFYSQQRTDEIYCALILDLVGHDLPLPGLEDLVFIMGMESDPGLARVLRNQGVPDGIRVVPTLNRYLGDMSDHHIFRLNRRPYLFFSCGPSEDYHQPTDTSEKLNHLKMAALTSYLRDVVNGICSEDLCGPFEGYDSTPDELFFMQRSLGHVAEAFGTEPRTRADLDWIAGMFVDQFVPLL
jgi:hypothetical protein